MHITSKLVAGVLLMGACQLNSLAQSVATWNGLSLLESASTPAATTAANLSAALTYQNVSLILNGDGAYKFFGAWNSASTIDGTEYIQLTLTPAPGYQVSLSGMSWFGKMDETNLDLHVRSSLDNFASDLGLFDFPPGAPVLHTVTFSQPTAATSDPITLRLYGTDAMSDSVFLYAGGTQAGQDIAFLTLNGAVSAVPEPSTWAALAGLSVLGFAMVRRRSVR